MDTDTVAPQVALGAMSEGKGKGEAGGVIENTTRPTMHLLPLPRAYV
jgi:hypothetical protein